MTAYAFIFARGGSKGLPRKNVRLLAGKPLLHYPIEVAQESGMFERVFVSTEDAEIAASAREAGATVIDRPPELATDTAQEWLSWRHAITWVREHVGEFDEMVSLPATCPLRSADDVKRALAKRRETGADICITVTPPNTNPYFTMVTLNEQGFCEIAAKHDKPVFRRQDAPVMFDITAVAYATTPDFVMHYSSLFQGKVTAVEVPKERAVDIDDIYDFMLAEAILLHHAKTGTPV